jgi:hypothetical protein
MINGVLLDVDDIEVTYGKARAVNGATVRVPRSASRTCPRGAASSAR